MNVQNDDLAILYFGGNAFWIFNQKRYKKFNCQCHCFLNLLYCRLFNFYGTQFFLRASKKCSCFVAIVWTYKYYFVLCFMYKATWILVACAKFHWYFRYSLKMATLRRITFFPKYVFKLVHSPQFLSYIDITLLSNVWSVNIIQTIQRKYTSTVFYVSNLHNRIKSWLIQSICSVWDCA